MTYSDNRQGAPRPLQYKKQSVSDPTITYRLIVHEKESGQIKVSAIGFIPDGTEITVTLPEDWPDKFGFSLA